MTIEEAVETYGSHIVDTVMSIVEVSDPDGAYVLFEDQGMWDEADCVAAIYFN